MVLLPLIQAQQKEITFINQVETYNVLGNIPITLRCISGGGDVFITESAEDGYTIKRPIIRGSILDKKYANRFSYSYNSLYEHRLVIQKFNRNQSIYAYECKVFYGIQTIILYVYYPPLNPPVCMTNYYTKKPHEVTIMQCKIELARPKVYIEIRDPNYKYYISSYISDKTHVTQQTRVGAGVNISSSICVISQPFPYGMHVDNDAYNKKYTCAFDSTKSSSLRSYYIPINDGISSTEINVIIMIIALILTTIN